MADAYTANLNMTLPEVGQSTDTWGTKLNAGLSILDAIFAPAGGGTSVGLHVGEGKALVIDGTGILAVAATCTATFGGAVSMGSLAVTGAITAGSIVAANVYTKTEADAAFLDQAEADARYVNMAGDNMTGGLSATEIWSAGAMGCAGAFTVAGYTTMQGLTVNGVSTIVGGFTLQNSAPTMTFQDTDWGPRYIHSNGGLIGFLTSGSAWALQVDNGGNTTATGNVAAYSDARLKTNVRTIENALDLVNRLRGVTYDRIDSGDHRVGLIAQEAQLVVPQVVLKDQDGMLAISYGDLVGVLVEAIKDLTYRVRELEANP